MGEYIELNCQFVEKEGTLFRGSKTSMLLMANLLKSLYGCLHIHLLLYRTSVNTGAEVTSGEIITDFF
jgi:hypothetical protein